MKEAFPEATIVRPAKLFGDNDRLLTWIALMATRTGRVPLVSISVVFPGICINQTHTHEKEREKERPTTERVLDHFCTKRCF